ncbi:PLC-like phosphodiesterase [Fusarium tricinctum]|uniref:PLC-like phosphodiesterase n=1 Tax=Fusarium tricinctum TaxID=61284 RepID=A0A8K0S5J5_9HYPO|nr:PLC-like phosphodiesterase [Fusarium tricinctum]
MTRIQNPTSCFTKVCTITKAPKWLKKQIPDSEKCVEGDRTYSSKTPKAGEYMRWMLMEPEYAATTGRQYVTIVNLTPHNFKLTSTHSYQMDEFDWDNIPPGKARQNVAHYTESVGKNPKDTNGEAYYSIEGTNKKFHVRATTRIRDTYPRRVVFDLTGMGAGQREYLVPEQKVPVITGSDSYGFITSLRHGPGNWMNSMSKQIANRKLVDMVMPGSHDAGKSKITDAILTGATDSNTRNQMLNIYNQLKVGSRFFDLRVSSVHQVVNCCGNYKFWISHLASEVGEAPIGRTGESFDEVIKEINDFTSEFPGEVIMLKFKYLVGIRNVPSKGPIYWDQDIKDDFFSKLKQINNRCPNLKTKGITKIEQLTMGELQKNKGGCVLIFLNTIHLSEKISDTNEHFSYKDGIYKETDLSLTDAWVNKEDTKDYPNVLMVDYIGMVLMNEPGWDDLSAELYTLAIGMNLRSPLLEIKSKSMRLSSSPQTNPLVSSWNGIILANGSRIDNPPSWLHPGRAEIYMNGTVFSNGTVLEKSVPNPDFEIGPGMTNSTLST